jgi:hypothetical protein
MVAAYTYVEAHNIPSLRGCSDVGFAPDHMSASVRRVGRRTTSMHPLTDRDRRLWDEATR